MDPERLVTLFVRLLKLPTKCVENTPPALLGTIFDLPLRIQSEVVHVMPRISTEAVKQIGVSAVRGDTSAMLTLSMLYAVGLGVPYNNRLAEQWASASLTEPGHVSFDEAKLLLRKHLEALSPGFQWPKSFDTLIKRFSIARKPIAESKIPACKMRVGPLVRGVNIQAVYRQCEGGNPYLFCALYNGRVLELDVTARLPIPLMFGQHTTGQTIVDYHERTQDLFNISAKVFVVDLVISIPTDADEDLLMEHHGTLDTATLFEKFCATVNDERKKIVPHPPSAELGEKIALLRSNIEALSSEERADRALNDYRRAVHKYRRAVSTKRPSNIVKDLHDQAIACKRKREKFANAPALIKKAKGLIVGLEKEFSAIYKARIKHENAQHYAYLENVFSIHAQGILYGNRDSAEAMPLGANVYTHLQSLGFITFSHPLMDSLNILSVNTKRNPIDVQKAVSIFKQAYPTLPVRGIQIYPMGEPFVAYQVKI